MHIFKRKTCAVSPHSPSISCLQGTEIRAQASASEINTTSTERVVGILDSQTSTQTWV